MSCDCHKHHEPASDPALAAKHKRALGAVMYINGGMALFEGAFGIVASSTALFTDMLEMAGDAAAAALGRIGVSRPKRWQAWAALAKAASMMALGLGAAGWVVFRILNPVLPVVDIMMAVGGLALGANAVCTKILYPYRNDNLNLKSSYECVKNDMVANLGVIGAGVVGKALASFWPDVIVAAVVSGIFIKSSITILREAIAEIKHPPGGSGKHSHRGHAHTHDLISQKFKLRVKTAFAGIFNRKAGTQKKPPSLSCGKKEKQHAP